MTLADDYNLRAAQASFTDVADLADSFEDILTWTPTYSYIGGGTSATIHTLHEARYIQLGGGRLVYVQAAAKVTLVGSGNIVTFSLPFAVSASPYGALSCNGLDGSGTHEKLIGLTELSRVDIIRSGFGNFTAGDWTFYFSGLYITT